MEDVLEVYHRDFAADEVLVCMDETSRQHIQETRIPLPARPGERERFDYEYGSSEKFVGGFGNRKVSKCMV